MRRALKWLGILVAALLIAVGGLLTYVWFASEAMLAERYDRAGQALEVPDDPASVEEGKRLAVARGCADCHGADLGGAVLDVGIAKFWGPNLTSHPDGAVTRLPDPASWELAIRHGIGSDGRPLLMMPAHELVRLPDAELGKIIAYARSAPPVSRTPKPTELSMLVRALGVFGQFPLITVQLADHALSAASKPPRAATVEYGEHLAKMGCIGCHGDGLSGGRIPGTPSSVPEVANLTPDPETGLGRWTLADFTAAIRTGKRPDGSAIDPFMPATSFAALDDVELGALWAYFQSLPPKPKGGR
ncbi:MAG: cytochrome c [Myxococcota bacterium]